jgi:hypothetical protein
MKQVMIVIVRWSSLRGGVLQWHDPICERRVDDVIECYVYWRAACAGVDSAYAAWHAARRGERRLAVAALDREQHAALVYSQMVESVAGFPERAAA